MNTNTFQNAKYAALGETWCRHQTARILSRDLQFGKHCRLDLDALLAGIARQRQTTSNELSKIATSFGLLVRADIDAIVSLAYQPICNAEGQRDRGQAQQLSGVHSAK